MRGVLTGGLHILSMHVLCNALFSYLCVYARNPSDTHSRTINRDRRCSCCFCGSFHTPARQHGQPGAVDHSSCGWGQWQGCGGLTQLGQQVRQQCWEDGG